MGDGGVLVLGVVALVLMSGKSNLLNGDAESNVPVVLRAEACCKPKPLVRALRPIHPWTYLASGPKTVATAVLRAARVNLNVPLSAHRRDMRKPDVLYILHWARGMSTRTQPGDFWAYLM